MERKFRLLRADEIECRVGQVNDKSRTFTLLLYKDARCDMDILDETVGADNWQRDHKEVKGNMFCGVSIYDIEKRAWITKWDCGTESNTEKEKGEASDSFKRANVNWGIGRELYTAPVIRIKDKLKQVNGKSVPDFWKMQVSEIGYNDKREINHLVIIGDGEVIYTYSNGKAKTAVETPKQQAQAKGAETPVTTVKTEPQAAHDELLVALGYGVQGRTGIKRFRDMKLVEIEACANASSPYTVKYAKTVLAALKSGKAFFDEVKGIDVAPF